jgi:tape measure domain-containing protein
MAIKEFVSLEGVDEVLARYKELQAGGEATAAAISDIGQPGGLAPVTVNIQQATQALTAHAQSSRSVTEAYHIMMPLLREAGISFGELRGLAALARGGLDGIAVAVLGSVAIALGSLSEDVRASQRTLTDFFGSAAVGKNVFDQLAASAGQLGTTVKAQLPALLSFVQAFQDAAQKSTTVKFVSIDPANLPSAANVVKLTEAFGTFQEVLRAGGATAAETTAAIAKFSAEMDKTGTVTGQMVKQLLTLAPGALPLLEQSFGKTGESAAKFVAELDKAPQPIKKFAEGLSQIKDAADKAFETRAPESFFENLKANLAGFGTAVQTGIIEPINKIKDTSQNTETVFSDLTAGGTKFFEGFAAIFAKNPIDTSQWNAAIVSWGQSALALFKNLATEIGGALSSVDWKGAFASLIAAGVGAEQAIIDGFNRLVATIAGTSWAGVFDGLLSAAQTIFDAIRTAWQAVVSFINQNQPQFQSPAGPTSFSEFAPGGAASGGLITGPGSTTSDSIFARLSNFEYVMRASAVKFYGVDFMHAINALRLPKDFFRSFNLGGLVLPPFPSPPRFAQGGLAMAESGSLRPVNIFFDRQKFALAGPADEVERLVKASVFEQLAAGGRSPSWRRS